MLDDARRRAEMLRQAWSAADHDNDLETARARFLRRKCCDGLARDVCSQAFSSAVAIAEAAEHFRRSDCPHNSPKPSRRYELLMQLAKRLEAEFPDAEPILIAAACRDLEQCWER